MDLLLPRTSLAVGPPLRYRRATAAEYCDLAWPPMPWTEPAFQGYPCVYTTRVGCPILTTSNLACHLPDSEQGPSSTKLCGGSRSARSKARTQEYTEVPKPAIGSSPGRRRGSISWLHARRCGCIIIEPCTSKRQHQSDGFPQRREPNVAHHSPTIERSKTTDATLTTGSPQARKCGVISISDNADVSFDSGFTRAPQAGHGRRRSRFPRPPAARSVLLRFWGLLALPLPSPLLPPVGAPFPGVFDAVKLCATCNRYPQRSPGGSRARVRRCCRLCRAAVPERIVPSTAPIAARAAQWPACLPHSTPWDGNPWNHCPTWTSWVCGAHGAR